MPNDKRIGHAVRPVRAKGDSLAVLSGADMTRVVTCGSSCLGADEGCAGDSE
jgi:hypothetical protein